MNLFFFFTYNTSLRDWKLNGSLGRELNYYTKIQKKGFKIHFITYGDKNDYKVLNKKNFKVIPIFAKIKKTKNKYLNFIKSFYFIFYLKNFSLNQTVFKTNQMKGSWLGILAAKIYKKKILLRSGYEYYRFCKLSGLNFLKVIIAYLYSFFAYRLANKISITSDYEKKFICKNFKIKKKYVSILPNFIDTEKFKKLKCNKVYDLIYVGRLENQKNIFLLLDAIKNQNLKLLLIGDGKLKSEIVNFCKFNKIQLKHLEKVSNNMLPKYYNSAKIFITTTLYEGNPKTILEAMSCEMPLITVKFKGYNSILKNNVNSIVVGYSKKKIREKIKQLLINKNLMKKIGKNARKKIITNNDINYIANIEYKILTNEIS